MTTKIDRYWQLYRSVYYPNTYVINRQTGMADCRTVSFAIYKLKISPKKVRLSSQAPNWL